MIFTVKFLERLTSMCNCTVDNDNIAATIECLQNVSSKIVTENEWNTVDYTVNMFPFVPTIDNYFLTDDPDKLLASSCSINSKIPVLLGSNRNEGFWSLMYFLYELMPNRELTEEEMTLEPEEYYNYTEKILSFYDKPVILCIQCLKFKFITYIY